MAKFDLKFLCASNDGSWIKCKLQEYQSGENDNIIIVINDQYSRSTSSIYLDKSTAIKLAKTLRTEINKIKDEDNG